MARADVSAILHRFADGILQVDRVLRLSIEGIAQVSQMVPLVEALANYEVVTGERETDDERDIESARKRSEFAQREIDTGFPVLHAQAVVASWGFIEAMVEDLVVCLLMVEPGHLSHDSLRRIRIPLAEYESLEPEERMRFLVKEFARQSSADLKQGVSGFEMLLDLVGLSGAIDAEIRRDLFELSQVRNVVVHRSDVADRRFCDACPWLGLSPGDQVRVSHEDYLRYSSAVGEYFTVILERDLVRTGVSPEEAATRMAQHHPRRKRP
jgi:hypothetical protein